MGNYAMPKFNLENGDISEISSPLLNPAFEPPRGCEEGKAAFGEKSEVTRPQEGVRTEAVI